MDKRSLYIGLALLAELPFSASVLFGIIYTEKKDLVVLSLCIMMALLTLCILFTLLMSWLNEHRWRICSPCSLLGR